MGFGYDTQEWLMPAQEQSSRFGVSREHSYRVFISYSREDYELAERLVGILRQNGLTPMWDKDFAYGKGFPDLIRSFIAHAHVFVPVMTEASSQRGWVHQEIGYAKALNVPILPVAAGKVPGEMLQQLLAVTWTDDVDEMRQRLSWQAFDNLVEEETLPLFECADLQEDRTMKMIKYTTDVWKLGFHGHVRQKGGLSSFHIPDKDVRNVIWRNRYKEGRRSTEFMCRLLRKERQGLEKHARRCGCSLIIDPYLSAEKYGDQARIVRLKSLIDFLEAKPHDDVKVAIKQGMPEGQHLTILGDWFTAESVSASPQEGYRQTIFTRHAPTVRRKIESFDNELNQSLRERDWLGHSRGSAIEEMTKILSEIVTKTEERKA